MAGIALLPKSIHGLTDIVLQVVRKTLVRHTALKYRPPTAILDEILQTAERALDLAHPWVRSPTGAPTCDNQTRLLDFTSELSILCAVQGIITWELIEGELGIHPETDGLLSAVRSALIHAAEDVAEHWQTVVASLSSPPTPPRTPTPSPFTPATVNTLPDHIIAMFLAHLPIVDFLHAAQTCKRWRAVALHPTNAAHRVRVKRVVENGCISLGSFDALLGSEVDLHSSMLKFDDLAATKHIRLLRPSSGAVHRALAALSSEPYYMCFREDTEERCSFAVETRDKHTRQFLDVRWDVWAWLRLSESGMRLLGGCVRRLTIPWTMSYKSADGMISVSFPRLKKLTIVVRENTPARGLQNVLRSDSDSWMLPRLNTLRLTSSGCGSPLYPKADEIKAQPEVAMDAVYWFLWVILRSNGSAHGLPRLGDLLLERLRVRGDPRNCVPAELERISVDGKPVTGTRAYFLQQSRSTLDYHFIGCLPSVLSA